LALVSLLMRKESLNSGHKWLVYWTQDICEL
jgi:hypothetical protein